MGDSVGGWVGGWVEDGWPGGWTGWRLLERAEGRQAPRVAPRLDAVHLAARRPALRLAHPRHHRHVICGGGRAGAGGGAGARHELDAHGGGRQALELPHLALDEGHRVAVLRAHPHGRGAHAHDQRGVEDVVRGAYEEALCAELSQHLPRRKERACEPGRVLLAEVEEGELELECEWVPGEHTASGGAVRAQYD